MAGRRGNDTPETLSPVATRPDGPTLAADLIIANAPDPVFVCDLDGKILEANEAVSRLLGLRRDEVLEQSLSRFISHDEAREFVVALREVVERGVTRNVRLHPRSVSGERIPTTLNASALRDTDGNITGAIGILRDMRELDQARAYAESLIKHAPDPVFVSDLGGKILQANDAVFSLLGFRPDELIEQSLSRIISPEDARVHGRAPRGRGARSHAQRPAAPAIVELHGDTVRADSEGEGRGATFVVELPLPADQIRPAPEPTAAVYRRPETGSPRLVDLDGRRILVVDDEADARDCCRRFSVARGRRSPRSARPTRRSRAFTRTSPSPSIPSS